MGTHKHYGSIATTDIPTIACRVRRDTAYTVPAVDATHIIPWDGEIFDTHGFHSPTTNPSRLTVPAGLGGLYDLRGGFVPNTVMPASKRAVLRFTVNGTQVGGSEVPSGSGLEYPSPFACIDHPLSAGDYVEFLVYLSGAGMPVDITNTTFSIRRVGSVA